MHGVRSRILDGLAAAFVVTIFWVPALVHSGRWLAAPLAAGVAAALLLCRRFPAWATATAAALTVAGAVLGASTDPMLAAAWCLYPLAYDLAGRVRAPLAMLAALLAGVAIVTAVPDRDPNGPGRRLLLSVVALTVAWLLGTMVGRQVIAERARVQLAVARDVHDVVGHALGVIGAEVGVTRSLTDTTPEELRESLAGIERHARGTLTEVQTLVCALCTPNPTLDQLGALVAAARASGVRVEADLSPIAEIDPRLAASLFRIAQESLSNVVRHAPGSRCRVTLAENAGSIVLSIHDDGPGPTDLAADPGRSRGVAVADSRPGHSRAGRAGGATGQVAALSAGGSGLIGMRERARLHGGTVTWGGAEPGFRVEARLARRSPR